MDFDLHDFFPTEGGRLVRHFENNSKSKEYQAHTSKVHSVGWSSGGSRLASGSVDKAVTIFALERDRLTKEHTFRGHEGSVDQLCWHSSNPNLLATASGDKTVRVWDVRTQKCAATVATKGENINIAWSPNGATIAVGNKEDLLTFINAREFRVETEQQFRVEVNEIKFSLGSSLFFLTTGQGCIQIVSYPELELQNEIKAHTATCISIDMDPRGNHFATGSADALVSLWDIEELACLRMYDRLDWPIRTLSFSHDGLMLAMGSEDLFIDVAETDTGRVVTQVKVTAPTFTVAWHPSYYLLAFACDDREQYDNRRETGTGMVKVFGFPSDPQPPCE